MSSNNPFVWASNNPERLFSVLYSDKTGRYRRQVMARSAGIAMDIVKQELRGRLYPCRVISARGITP